MTPRALLRVPAVLLLLAACSRAGAPPEPALPGGVPPAPSAATGSPARSDAPSPADGIYGAAQADRGRRVFGRVCSECHYSSELQGEPFLAHWGRRTVGDLYGHVATTMPEDAPGSLAPEEYLQVVAYILRLNGFPAGTELRAGGPAFGTGLGEPDGRW